MIATIIIWVIGSIFALIGSERLREWRDYDNPVSFLIVGILLCICMSWCIVALNATDGSFSLPKKIYHKCEKNAYVVSYEDEYINLNGNTVTPKDSHIRHYYILHNVYYKCSVCGKEWKKQVYDSSL